MEKDIEILLDFIKYIRFNEEKHYTIDKYYTAIENSVEHMRKLINKNKELEKERDGIYADYQEIGKDLLKAHEKNEEQEKIIELMAEYIKKTDFITEDYCVRREDCENVGGNRMCKDCITEYFKKKARENNGYKRS